MMPEVITTINFNEDDIKEYLDRCIRYWRQQKTNSEAIYYIDAYQSMRTSIFGELLPIEEEAK